MSLPGWDNRARPSPYSPATLVLVHAGGSTTLTVAPGQRLLVGRNPGAAIVVTDPAIGPNHALIERRGPGWLVTSLDPTNPTLILDSTGRAQPIEGQLGLRAGELLVGGCQILLYPPAP
jgi:pSer/pThr/pTyr-binding forkhead associated (FHA) protein